MAQTQVTQINLYVSGNLRGASQPAHRIYDMGSFTEFTNPEAAFRYYDGMTISHIAQMDLIAKDFLTVTSARIEVSTTITRDVPQPVTV